MRKETTKVNVEQHYGAYIVFFEEYKKDILLQSDYDQAAFAYDCGLIKEPDPTLLENVDLTDIDCAPTFWIEL